MVKQLYSKKVVKKKKVGLLWTMIKDRFLISVRTLMIEKKSVSGFSA